MQDFVISECQICGKNIKVYRQLCGKLIPRKWCDACIKDNKSRCVKLATKRFIELSKNDENFKKFLKRKKGPTSNETKRKLRIASINYRKRVGIAAYPNFNQDACKMIDDYGKENGYNFQHAMNGGEYHIKELGYFVDGYDKEKNAVLEIDEKHHNRQINKDAIRQAEIQEFLNCEFIRIPFNKAKQKCII